MKGWMYILECSDGSYYTGSTNNLVRRIQQHDNGEGAKHTKLRLPVKLLYSEEFSRIDYAFYREKQVQGWSRKKKEALISGKFDLLPELSVSTSSTKGVLTDSNSEVSTSSTFAKGSTAEVSGGSEESANTNTVETNGATIKGDV